jgi:hypothetical protein
MPSTLLSYARANFGFLHFHRWCITPPPFLSVVLPLGDRPFIQLHGFEVFEPGNTQGHYFDLDKGSPDHDVVLEKRFLQKLVKTGKLTLL